jgi:acetyl-CoA C-acetyltransferase
MTLRTDNLPVIIGVGQVVNHWDGVVPEDAPSPLSLAKEAIGLAAQDTGKEDNVRESIDVIAVTRLYDESLTPPNRKFGYYINFPRAICDAVGLNPRHAIYSKPGGDQPQSLAAELSNALHTGEYKAALLVGAEAKNAFKLASKNRHTLDWSSSIDGQVQDRGVSMDAFTEYELKNGLGSPHQNYALLEQAFRHSIGLSLKEYTILISELLAGFSKVAAAHPIAQFPKPWNSEALALQSKENYPIADPYLKWHIAQDSVNQSAAIILTTLGQARSWGIDNSKIVYLHSHAAFSDSPISERPVLGESEPMKRALAAVLKSAGLSASQMAHIDIYSCFPIVVLLAAKYLNLDWRAVPLTITGGLPFFGGPGNNYSSHAIATLVQTLRNQPSDYGLILANGGFLSKQAAGIYSAQPPKHWTPFLGDQKTETKPVSLLSETCDATIETYTITHDRFGPNHGVILAQNGNGRVMAKVRSGHHATLRYIMEQDSLIGQPISVTHENGKNYIDLIDPLGTQNSLREFQHIMLKRDGHVLEITLNRPESYNALFSECHYELTEVFDAYENDPDLWAAIITGAGDKAFCSGNDLKKTAEGGNITIPRAGFAGLTNRLEREKPIIAAVNGVAMGGGLEIVLACDIAVAAPHAQFALPEVKVGLFAAAGGLQRLSRHIGRKAAMELILTGRKVDAEEARHLGLINSVTVDESALTAARRIANTITKASPSAIRASKRVLNSMDKIEDLKEQLEASHPVIKSLLKTQDFKEGIRAFAEKRAPNWVNK